MAARGREDPAGRPVALRFAVGIGLVQLGWVLRLAPRWTLGVAGILILGVLDLAIPIWAERAGRPTPWNPEHIAERYGLFTIIVLGECVLADEQRGPTRDRRGGVSPEAARGRAGRPAARPCPVVVVLQAPAEIDRGLSLRRRSRGVTATTSSSRRSPRSVPGSRSRSTRHMRKWPSHRPGSP